MSKTRRFVSPVGVIFGVVFVLVVIVGFLLVKSMNREGDEASQDRRVAQERADEQRPGPPGSDRRVGRPRRRRTARTTIGDGEESGSALEEGGEPDVATVPTGYSISGQVVDEKGNGIAKAEVVICFEYSFEAERHPLVKRLKSDAAGNFHARHLPRKRLLLTAVSDDACFYLPGVQLRRRRAWSYPVPYIDGKDSVTDVRLVLRPGAVLAGSVVDDEGAPLTNATVTIWRVRDGHVELAVDDQGRFRASNLVPGEYYVKAIADGFVEIWLVPVVRTGREDLVIRLRRGVPVEGTVVFAESGDPVEGAAVRARAYTRGTSQNQGIYFETNSIETDRDGRFEMLICPEAETKFTASKKECFTQEGATIIAEVGVPPEPVTITLAKGATISGTVLDHATNERVEGVRVRARSKTDQRRFVSNKSDEQGAFSLVGVAAGLNGIGVSSNKYEFYNPDEGGGDLSVEVPQGETVSGIEVKVREKTAVSGTVTNTEGDPVFGAVIVLKEETAHGSIVRGAMGYSEAEGRFVLHAQRATTITGLLVSHPQYANTFVSFEPDATRDDVRVVLEETGGSIEGFVWDEGGAPVPQVVVDLMDMETFAPYYDRYVQVKSAVTDEDGHYILASVADGAYHVKARLGHREITSGRVHVAEGDALKDINLTLALPGHIAGQVTNDTGSPIEGLHVSLTRIPEHQDLPWTTTDEEGKYRFEDLEEGAKYRVSVSIRSKGPYVGEDDREATCSADDVDFIFTEYETGTVSGFVYDESDGNPVEHFNISIRHKSLYVWAGGEFHSEEGAFLVEKVAAGASTIEIRADGFPEIKGEPFEVVAGEETIRIIYLPASGTVRGRVCRTSDQSPVNKFRLSLMRREGRGRGPSRGKEYESDDGSFLCNGVKPGTYTIGVIAEGVPDFETKPFEVAANEETVLDIFIGEGGIIRGTVVDGSGSPVAGAVVAVSGSVSRLRSNMGISRSGRGSYQRPHATTGNAGDFELANVAAGTVTLSVKHADYAPLEMRGIPVSQDAPTENVTLRIVKGTAVYGWVKDLDGEPRGNVRVRVRGRYMTPSAIVSEADAEVRINYSASAQTDYQGQYRIEHIPGGDYHLSVDYLDTSLPRFTLVAGEEKEINIDFTEAGTVAGTLHVPAGSDEFGFQLYLYGRDEMAGYRRRLRPDEKNTFEVQGVFPGTYTLHIRAYWKDRERGRHDPTVKTDPREITIQVAPKERVTQDVTITNIEERK